MPGGSCNWQPLAHTGRQRPRAAPRVRQWPHPIPPYRQQMATRPRNKHSPLELAPKCPPKTPQNALARVQAGGLLKALEGTWPVLSKNTQASQWYCQGASTQSSRSGRCIERGSWTSEPQLGHRAGLDLALGSEQGCAIWQFGSLTVRQCNPAQSGKPGHPDMVNTRSGNAISDQPIAASRGLAARKETPPQVLGSGACDATSRKARAAPSRLPHAIWCRCRMSRRAPVVKSPASCSAGCSAQCGHAMAV